ncbi:MAG: hypothetical protein JSS05_14780 [Proteobacteria bacterium]|nr:hypothetical protein [Pseudomonadota bacterium]
MLALKIMLTIYVVVAVVAVAYALIWPRVQRWMIARGARDANWMIFGDDPPGFKQLQDELKEQRRKP